MDLPKISESIAAKTTGESLNRHRMDVRVAAALSAVLNAPELRMLYLMCKVDGVMHGVHRLSHPTKVLASY